jgi:3D-(3,5/4)-trihydroxycyclohexane-1,2-dione acylhydrolase (decyclizing)
VSVGRATVRTTVADAIVRFLISQKVEDDRSGEVIALVPGVFAIFGHGNALSLGESLELHKSEIATLRGQNEQGMALAAVAYAKAARRRQIMAVSTSIGPGALNTVTAAGVALANRLPLLLLLGDTFNSREPDPVLQQLEHFGDPTITANDSLKAVSRYWDRITAPSQLKTTLLQAIATLLDPADCGPVTLALPQDVQAMAYDFPADLFETVVHRIARPRPSRDQVSEAIALIRAAKKPMIIAGGGVHYSLAEAELSAFANAFGIPVMETVAGKSSLLASDPAFAGSIGVFGETAGQEISHEADLVIALGTRLQDFTTESGTVFRNPDVKVIGVNVARYDALKRQGTAVVGDAREVLAEFTAGLQGWAAPAEWFATGRSSRAKQVALIEQRTAVTETNDPTYAQLIGRVHAIAGDDDYVLTAAGGLPGELVMNWPSKGIATFDCEYGFSCMGYEVSGTWGAALERAVSRPGSTVYGMSGDGSFMMLPMDVYSAVLHNTSLVLIICDNQGFNVIERLQIGHGAASFRTMLADEDRPNPAAIDFAKIAAGMGAEVISTGTLSEFDDALHSVKGMPGVHVIVAPVEKHKWSEGDSFWEVGVPEVSHRPAVNEARKALLEGKSQQR